MIISLASFFLTATALPQAAPAPQAAVQSRATLAMTKDGIRVEVGDRPAVGSGKVETPFGSYFTPLDTVAVVLTVPRTTTWRAELAANPMTSLLPVIGRINGDGRIADLLELTQNIELLWENSPSDEIARLRAKELVAASNALWKWGQRLNPVPEKLDQDERVEWLWERVLKSDGPTALLYGGRLMEEVIQAQGGIGDRQVTQTQLSRAMKSKNPYQVRSAAQLAGFEHVMEVQFGAHILYSSIFHQHPVARDGCAVGIAKLYPNHARLYWVDNLFGGKDEHRIRAAWHLVDHLPKQAAGPLVAGLAATTTRVSRQITVGGLTLRVEDRVRPAHMPLRAASTTITALGQGISISGGDP